MLLVQPRTSYGQRPLIFLNNHDGDYQDGDRKILISPIIEEKETGEERWRMSQIRVGSNDIVKHPNNAVVYDG